VTSKRAEARLWVSARFSVRRRLTPPYEMQYTSLES
jgi:hypothetical protein